MSTGQMMLAVLAIMMFGVVGVNMRRTMADSDTYTQSNTFDQQEVVIGRAMIDEMTQKAFDVAVVNAFSSGGNHVVRLADLSTCGSAAGEYYPNFNDVDDFNGSVFTSPNVGAKATSSTPRCLWNTEGFKIGCRVGYVDENNPDKNVAGPTWAKRIDLTISCLYSSDTLRISHVIAY